MIKIDKAENCTIVDTMHVDKIDTPQMIVQQQFVGKGGSKREGGKADLRLAALAKYVPLAERVEDIAAQLQTVKCAQDFKMVVRQIVDMYTPQQKGVIISRPFRDALMAFVADWHPSDDAVYRQCNEVYKE